MTEVAAGQTHTLAVTSTGQLYSFGDNYYGELGNATDNGNSTVRSTPGLVTLPGATGGVEAPPPAAVSASRSPRQASSMRSARTRTVSSATRPTENTQSPNPTPTLVTLPLAQMAA